MRAVGYLNNLPVTSNACLVDLELQKPTNLGPRDILVQVRAVSVNPVDYKIRLNVDPKGQPKILGWDAAGVVEAVGSDVRLFKVGDDVYYAGDLTRPGSNSEFQVVDERIVGYKPKSLNYEESAALPLTTITAYEALFDRLQIQNTNVSSHVMIIGGAGGVGSIAIQLIKALTPHRVIATASRTQSLEWCLKMGADEVIDHSKSLPAQFKEKNLPPPKFVFSTNESDHYLKDLAELIEPQGKICLIDDPSSFDILPFKKKSVSVHWELMFTRSLYQTVDAIEQHRLLNKVAQLIDSKKLAGTGHRSFGKLNSDNLIKAHAYLESRASIGKVTLFQG